MFGLGLGQVSMGSGGGGIAYARPQPSGQTTSFRTGDDAWHWANNTWDYTDAGTLAVLDASAGSPFLTLTNDNAFGNKNRFTNSLGTQTTYDGTNGETAFYCIDHLTGLGWYLSRTFGNWNDAIDNGESATYAGFSDWRLGSLSEQLTLMNREVTGYLNYAPFNFASTASYYNTSTTSKITTTEAIKWNREDIIATLKTTGAFGMYCRNHY